MRPDLLRPLAMPRHHPAHGTALPPAARPRSPAHRAVARRASSPAGRDTPARLPSQWLPCA